MSKLKIMFISAANSIHTVRWVNSLSNEFEIHLVYCKNHRPNIDNINSKVVLHELKFKAPYGYYLNVIQLRNLYKKIKPDIINAHYASGYGTLVRLAKIRPVLLSVWGSDVYDFPNESKLKKKILQKNIMFADEIASTSNIMAEELKRQVPTLRKEIHITPFGIDIQKFKKEDIKHNNSIFKIGNVKALKEVYGIEYGILAVKILKDKLSKTSNNFAKSIQFEIYGDGEEKEKLEELIRKEELQDCVFLKGKIQNDEVPNVLNNIDVFCVTSNKESFGVALVEAMACEVPIVSTDADGFSEVMVNNETGYIVERRNVQQIANALEKLLNNPKQRIEFGKNGRKRVIENYNWEDNVKKMEEIYTRMEKNK